MVYHCNIFSLGINVASPYIAGSHHFSARSTPRHLTPRGPSPLRFIFFWIFFFLLLFSHYHQYNSNDIIYTCAFALYYVTSLAGSADRLWIVEGSLLLGVGRKRNRERGTHTYYTSDRMFGISFGFHFFFFNSIFQLEKVTVVSRESAPIERGIAPSSH